MNRRLQWLNLAGVLVLAGLCVLQWRQNRSLNLELNRRESDRLELQTTVGRQARDLRGLSDDLALFKEQVVQARSEGRDQRQQLAALERDHALVVDQRDQLQASITNWVQAVNARDARLAQANESIGNLNDRIRQLADQLNASILKYNELASNYTAAQAGSSAPSR